MLEHGGKLALTGEDVSAENAVMEFAAALPQPSEGYGDYVYETFVVAET